MIHAGKFVPELDSLMLGDTFVDLTVEDFQAMNKKANSLGLMADVSHIRENDDWMRTRLISGTIIAALGGRPTPQ